MTRTDPPMVVLRAGDRVLVALNDSVTDDQAREYGQVLNQAFPGVEFVLATGVDSLSVMSSDDVNTS